MPDHTPEPWTFDAERGLVHGPDDAEPVALVYPAAEKPMVRANGRLLAAAPALKRAASRLLHAAAVAVHYLERGNYADREQAKQIHADCARAKAAIDQTEDGG